MALITTGLTNGGVTAHYKFQYDNSLQQTTANPAGIEPARTNAVMAACEGDFNLMSGWFGNIAVDFNLPAAVNVTQNSGGAAWGLGGGNLTVTINPGAGVVSFVRYLLVSEIVEQFMRAQGLGWYGSGTEGSEGEGLSRFLAARFLAANGFGNPPAGFANSNSWLSSTRADFVNNINLTDDGPDAITGCSLLFIYYLFSQLGFSINQIVAAGAPTLGGVYRNLTGDSGDPFPFFKQLMDTALPGTSTITTGNLDDPFPVGMLAFWVDKSTFGRDEVNDVIGSASNGSFPNAFWLMLDGFNIQSFNALGIGVPSLSGPFSNLSQISITPNISAIEFELPLNPTIPQRVRFAFDVRFTTATLTAFPTPGSGPFQEVLKGSASVAGRPLPGASAITEFELVGGADPYFTNIDANQDNVFWLSQDLRVFTATPALNGSPVVGAPAFTNDSIAGAYGYIQSVLTFLNDPTNQFTDGTLDPFVSGVIPAQAGAYSGDSSVTPFTIQFFPVRVSTNYNFAVARVRLRGTAGPAGAAQNVKAFFRMWSTQSADTDFQPGSTYRSQLVGGRPRSPLPATDSHTFPFFATSNNPDFSNPANPEYGTNGVNNRLIQIATGDRAFAYFGCFLNVYDPANIVNGSPVQTLMTGTHHCLVAELAYDDAPIINANGVTMSPENSDKLAQRNLQVTHSDNPGPADTHRIPQTFDLRPSAPITLSPGLLLDQPDELMIDWGATPVGSVAHIYWPQVNAVKVLELASKLYGTHVLSASDANTIDCTVRKGVTYVPIPPGIGENFAGLLTIDLPTTITTGQEFDIVVRRVATRRVETVILKLAGRGTATQLASRTTVAVARSANRTKHEQTAMRNWRYVVGTFQVKIPVATSELILFPEENTLAIMKWRLEQMKPSNRWHPVLERYVGYLAARVDGLGGDSRGVLPSPNGVPVKEIGPAIEHEHRGKVGELLFDCFGDFEGFVLEGCCAERHVFRSRERAVGELALRACKERLTVVVWTNRKDDRVICRLAVRC